MVSLFLAHTYNVSVSWKLWPDFGPLRSFGRSDLTCNDNVESKRGELTWNITCNNNMDIDSALPSIRPFLFLGHHSSSAILRPFFHFDHPLFILSLRPLYYFGHLFTLTLLLRQSFHFRHHFIGERQGTTHSNFRLGFVPCFRTLTILIPARFSNESP